MTRKVFDPDAFSGRLETLRRERGLTAKAVADGSGVSETSLSEFQNGRRMPSAEALAQLSQFFGVSADYLLCLTNVRCRMPDAGTAIANASELEQVIAGIPSKDPRVTFYEVGDDIRAVTPEERRLLGLPLRERRKMAKAKKGEK